MNRFFVLLFATCALLMLSFASAAAASSDFAGGTGTEGDPYIIVTPEQLDKVRDELDAHYKLAADIDLSAYNGGEWEPIASTGDGFEGSFNGDGHTISGLMINRSSDDYVGLFGKVAVSGSIRHVKLEVVNIQGKNYVGGLAGQSSGTIDNAAVSGGSVKGEKHVGGLVGRVLGVSDETTVITNSYASGDVTGTAITDGGSGGLVGIIESKTNSLVEIKNSYASGDVTSTVIAGGGSGGLVGFIKNEKTEDNSTSITDSYASGNVKTGGDGGGLVGTIRNENTQNNSTFITNSYASGEVKVEASGGGLVGYIRFLNDSDSLVDIKNSYASGNVTGDFQLGGLIGINQIHGSGTTSIQYVYSTGNVEGNSQIGGLIGLNAKSTSNAKLELVHSYVKGKVTKTETYGFGFGGLMGSDNGTGTTEISDSYWNSSVYEDDDLPNNGLGTPKTIEDLEELMEELTFTSWHPDLWYQFDDHDPILKWANPLESWEVSIVDESLKPGDETKLQVMTTHADGQQFKATHVSAYQLLHSGIVKLDGTTVKAVKGGKATIEATLYGETKQLEIIVDSGDPDAPTITLETDEWTKATEVKATVNHNVTSATLADIDKIRVKIGDAPWEDYHYDELPIQTSVIEEGQTVIQAQAIDVIGNSSAIVHRTVKISRTGLIMESQMFHTEDHAQTYIIGNWTNQSVTADVYVSHDHEVTIVSVVYSIDEGSTWIAYDDPLVFSTEGQHSLWLQAKDAAGNEMNEQLIINIDHTSPAIIYDPDGNHAPSRNVSTQVVVTDGASGIDKNELFYIWSKNNHKLEESADWKPFDPHSPLSLTGETGEWHLHIRAADQAGNESYAISQPFALVSGGHNSGHTIPPGYYNAELDELTLSAGQLTPDFAADVTEYYAQVANEIDHIQLNVRAAYRLAEVTINGERIQDQETIRIPLAEGMNKIEVTVKAAVGTENTYTLTIERLASSSEKSPLTDISGHWAEASIQEALNRGFINGYPDGTFKPNQPMTRAEFTVMLVSALHLEGEGETLDFADRDRIGAWAQHAIGQAVEAGLISGYDDGTFRPDLPITRAEMAVMIARATGVERMEVAETNYSDDANIPVWAKGYVQAMREIGVINGRGGNQFAPDEATTRAEAVVGMLSLLNQH